MLTIYSASAGSGKTYNLVLDYLATCFRHNLPMFLKMKNRDGYVCTSCNGYRGILAITFTNNAAAEMKARVVEFLNRLVFAKSFNDLKPDDFDNLCKKVFDKDLEISRQDCFVFLHESSKTLLHSILYDYARFSITTIDSFIQRVIRSSALYLNLSMNYAVQIHLTDFYQKAIEQYVSNLLSDHQQFDIIVSELLRQLEDDGKSNVNRFLSKALDILYYDAEKSHPYVKKFPEMVDLLAVVQQWRIKSLQILAECKKSLKPLSEQAATLFKTAETEGIFPNGKSKWNLWFAQVVDDPFNTEKGFDKSKCIQEFDETKVFTTKSKKKDIIALKEGYAEQIKDLFYKVRDIVLKNAKEYFSNRILSKNANQLLVLNALKSLVNDIKIQTDSFFLVESNPLLNDEIQSDSGGLPVFEKMSFYKHFFIDEFQDTSLMQWEDLKPLIVNVLSNAGDLTLFGDVKQSIYRFRNGEVDLFYRLSDYGRLQAADTEQEIAQLLRNAEDYRFEPLRTNYRSYSAVVSFNNRFFRFFAEKLGKSDYYTDVKQRSVKKKQGGLVQIFDIAKNDKRDICRVWSDCSEDFYQDVYMKMRKEEAALLFAVMDAKQRGYRYGDMAVLLTGRTKCTDFAQCLMLAGIPVVTTESLQLCDNPNINLIISTLRYLINQKDTLAQTVILDYFARSRNQDFNEILCSCNHEELSTILEQHFGILNFKQTVDRWLCDPFLLTVKDIIRFYELDPESDPFVADFLDLTVDFSHGNIASISDFLYWWDDINRYGDSIPRLSLSGSSDAVQLMTVHKSKGLEFPVVITYCSVSPGGRDTYYWVTDESSGQGCYVKHEKSMQYSDFQEDYEEEEDKKNLDGLNLWYVDFTRAKQMLYILADLSVPQNENDKWNVKRALRYFVNPNEADENAETEGEESYSIDHVDGTYYYGDHDWWKDKGQPDEKAAEVDKVTEEGLPTESEFRVSFSDMTFCDNPSVMVIKREPDTESLETGTHIHDFLQKLTVFPSSEAERDAVTDSEPEEIRVRLHQLFERVANDPAWSPYFYISEWDRVLNEVPIIMASDKVRRPDRIVFKPDHVMIIDYKTGREYKAKYEAQLAEYQKCLTMMGFKDVRTKILYID